MRKFFLYSVFLVAFASVNLVAQKKRVAIVDFDFGTVQRWWGGNWDIGKGIADMVVNELVNDGTYSVIERKKMNLVMAEQNFSNSDRADASTAAKIGKLLSVNGMVVGSITQFGTEKKGFGIGGIGGKFGKFGGGQDRHPEGDCERKAYGSHRRHQHR